MTQQHCDKVTDLYHTLMKDDEEIEREKELQRAYQRGYEDGKHDTRTRPYPAPQAPKYPPSTGDMMEDAYHRGLVDGAANERERVLEELKKFIRGNTETIEAYDGTLEDAAFCGDLFAWIDKQESLREGAK